MIWADHILRHRRALIILGIAFCHAVAFAAVLNLRVEPVSIAAEEQLVVELADLLPDLPEPEPEPERVAEPVAPAPLPGATYVPEVAPLEVLAQDAPNVEPSDKPVLQAFGSVQSGTDAEALDQVANALTRAKCRRDLVKRDPDCSEQDPFEVLAEKFELQEAANQLPGAPADTGKLSALERHIIGEKMYTGTSVLDGSFAAVGARDGRASSQLNLWPDKDLFTDTMAAGAYQAERIRNGKSLMDKDLERELGAGRD